MKFKAILLLFLIFGITSQSQTEISREIKQITLSGSGYKLGLQHGQALKSEISKIVTKWKENTTRTFGKDSDIIVDKFFDYAHFTEAIQKWTPELYEEVRGIADGSEQKFNDIFVLNLLDEFWVYIDNISNHHCSDVGVASVNGNPSYIAQNMDIESYTDGFQTLITIERNENRPEQLILTHPGLIALNGMNEDGVGVVVNTIMQLKASSEGLPVAFVIRHIVNSTDKGELLEFIQKVNHASGQNYIIGIRGEVYDFEASSNKVVRYDPKNKNGTVYHTNHPIVNTDLKSWYKNYNPNLKDESLPKASNSYVRLDAIKSRMLENSEINDAIIKEALRSKDSDKHPVCNTNTVNSFGFTFASVVMTLSENPYLQITAGPPDESEYTRIDFSKK